MPYCWNCRIKLEEDTDLCPKCGEKLGKLSDELTAQSALLDFYSDRAVAHASFLLASIFGLVALLTIVQEMISAPSPTILIHISLVSFVILSYAGYHTFRKFGHYAADANNLVWQIQTHAPKSKEWVDEIASKARRELPFTWILDRITDEKWRALALSLPYAFFMTVLSSIVYLQSKDTSVKLSWVLAIVALFISIFVFLEPIRTLLEPIYTLILRASKFFKSKISARRKGEVT